MITGASLSGSTVNVALPVIGSAQSLVAVHVTTVSPPHASGAPGLSICTSKLQPPVIVPVATHASNAAFTSS